MFCVNGCNSWLVLGLAAWLVGGCLSGPPAELPSGANVPESHAGIPMSCSPRVSGVKQAAPRAGSFPPDFVLRPGEKLICLPCADVTPGVQAPSGCRGRWRYEPNLTAGYLDFVAGVQARAGIGQSADGLNGAGWCVFAFGLPGAIAPGTNGASVVVGASGDVNLEVSDPWGGWHAIPVVAAGREEALDVSAHLLAQHAFCIRLTLGANAHVTTFRFEGNLLLDAASPPSRLAEGVNVMALTGRDKYGLATMPCEFRPDFRAAATIPLEQRAVIRHGRVVAGADGRHMIEPDGSAPVEATFTFDAPEGELLTWFSARAIVGMNAQGAATQPQVQMEWCRGNGAFLLLVHDEGGGARHNARVVAGEQVLDRSSRSVKLRVTSDAPIGGVELDGHLDLHAAFFVRPEITHRWLENGAERQFVAPPGAEKYFFRCGPAPTGHVVELRLPSYRDLPHIPVVNPAAASLR